MPPELIRLHTTQHPGRKDQLAATGPGAAQDGDRLVDRAEFQGLLGISRSCFERWLAMGKIIEPIRLSRTCHRWRWSEVQQWIADGCPDPRQPRARR